MTFCIAQQIKALVEGSTAFTLYGGYATFLDKDAVRFATGHQEQETRNPRGRVTYARYRYADNSKLEYNYREDSGYALNVIPPSVGG